MRACAQNKEPLMSRSLWISRTRLIVAVVAAASFTSACYVVPVDPRTGQPVQPQSQSAPPAAVAAPVTFPSRLYPANDLASRYGMINATVTNDLHGRGTFNAVINGEAFAGEATRKAGSSREGIANGAGNRGSYLSCNYTLNSSTQGVGQCKLSDGAVFTMHLGN